MFRIETRGTKGDYPQGRAYDENSNSEKDVDHTDHGRPGTHTNPHQQRFLPNPTGGYPKRGPQEPLNFDHISSIPFIICTVREFVERLSSGNVRREKKTTSC